MPFEKDRSGEPPVPIKPPVTISASEPEQAASAAATVLAGRSSPLPSRMVCRIVGQITGELLLLVGTRLQLRGERRRALCHARQIAMYVCHVALRIPQQDIGRAFGRDRTTVGHACSVVEDRRDEPAFDDFVSVVERIVTSIFSVVEVECHG